MKQNPNVEICAMKGGDWIRINAKAILDDNRAARAHMLECYPELMAMYDPDDGNTEVFMLTEGTATVYSFTKPPVSHAF